jgi:hypothetical protein
VIGVLLICAIVGGLILARVLKGRRNKPKTLDYCDVYAPTASHISLYSYAEVGAGPSQVTFQSYADVGRRPPYRSVQSYAYVGSDSNNATKCANVEVQAFAISR